ncbi:hypothetical protein FIBSPDRAFT_860635 [Athelia psychrophila]|uniref:Uncharacterized protein n=1 Tax=Athelia psychrophila TaxID=1759441 RepID=A0A166K2D8_9AGAM|nr:hypothetical protein FIBSPDRAFT_860635 [Fibularhizoctonia sp. CBS 109695]
MEEVKMVREEQLDPHNGLLEPRTVKRGAAEQRRVLRQCSQIGIFKFNFFFNHCLLIRRLE